MNSAIEPSSSVVARKTTNMLTNWSGLTPPNRKTRLNSGSEHRIKSTSKASPATNLPSTMDGEESRVASNRSSVCRWRSPLTASAVEAGVTKMISAIWKPASQVNKVLPILAASA